MVYLMNALGAKQLMITNAAGALNPAYQPGEIMIIHDHLNFTGSNPLIGQDDTMGNRFVDMSKAYHPITAAKALHCASELNLNIHTGIYAGVLGPSLETSAERRMLQTAGADAVGMSTVLEVIAANHCQMNVLGLSAITNMALGDSDQQVDTIEAVLENAAVADKGIAQIIGKLISDS
jgi:purine-nucleoside phosphorylase